MITILILISLFHFLYIFNWSLICFSAGIVSTQLFLVYVKFRDDLRVTLLILRGKRLGPIVSIIRSHGHATINFGQHVILLPYHASTLQIWSHSELRAQKWRFGYLAFQPLCTFLYFLWMIRHSIVIWQQYFYLFSIALVRRTPLHKKSS